LIALRAMFPNLDDFAEHFVDLATSVDTLRKNAQALERFTEGQSGEQRTKNLYFAENAVVTHAWNVFVFTAKISAQIPENCRIRQLGGRRIPARQAVAIRNAQVLSA
jgi:hypothetical protein